MRIRRTGKTSEARFRCLSISHDYDGHSWSNASVSFLWTQAWAQRSCLQLSVASLLCWTLTPFLWRHQTKVTLMSSNPDKQTLKEIYYFFPLYNWEPQIGFCFEKGNSHWFKQVTYVCSKLANSSYQPGTELTFKKHYKRRILYPTSCKN